jgi:hypothetical protein
MSLKFLTPFKFIVSPSFYKAQLDALLLATHKDMQAGKIDPLFKAMLFVGVTGYIMNYTFIESKKNI